MLFNVLVLSCAIVSCHDLSGLKPVLRVASNVQEPTRVENKSADSDESEKSAMSLNRKHERSGVLDRESQKKPTP